MTKKNQEDKVINIGIPSIKVIAKFKSIIQLTIGIVILLFFFNFFTITCNDSKLVAITGINLVVGTNISEELNSGLSNLKGVKSFDENGNIKDEDTHKTSTEEGKIAPNFFAILAFAMLFIGLVILWVKLPFSSLITCITVSVAFLSLLVVRLSIENNLLIQSNEMIRIEVESNFAYWLALLLLLFSSLVSYVRWKKGLK